MQPNVYRITYKNKTWELRSVRYYSAEDVTEAVLDFIYCFKKGRVGEKRLTIKKIHVWNRFSGKWDNMTREGVEFIQVLDPDEMITATAHADNTISMRRL